jgi:predicted metal-dependent hydrolase
MDDYNIVYKTTPKMENTHAPKVTIRRQKRRTMMMRVVPTGIEVFIPSHLKPNSRQVRDFIQTGLAQLQDRVPPAPVEQITPEAIRTLVDGWAARIGVQPKRVQLRLMHKKWGSCSSRGTITLNRALCWLPETLVHYVICHELAHLRVFNHGEAFQAMMTTYIPDWREREATLHKIPI